MSCSALAELGGKIRFGYRSNEVGFGWTNAVFAALLDALPPPAKRGLRAYFMYCCGSGTSRFWIEVSKATSRVVASRPPDHRCLLPKPSVFDADQGVIFWPFFSQWRIYRADERYWHEPRTNQYGEL